MKKAGFLFFLFAISFRAHPQCTPDTSILAVGFYPPDTLLPCIEDSLYYDEVLQFKNFSQVSGSVIGFPGLTITIISVQIDSVNNLPPGINYECNTPNCIYTTGESGCVRLSGMTTAPPGIYNLGFYATLTVDIGFGPFNYPADSQFLASNGLGYALVVISQGGICPNKHSGQLYLNASIITPSVCDGDTVPFHALASGGQAPYTYIWSPGTNLSDSTLADPLLYPSHPGAYTVTVTDNVGLSATDAVTVSYSQGPTINLTQDTSICPGGSAQLIASGGTSYSWFPAAGLDATNIPNPVASPSQNTTYNVIVSNGGCSAVGDVTVTIDTVYPQASFDSVVNNLTVLFINTSTGASDYYWDFGDGNTSTDKNPQHPYAQHSSYEVTLIAGNSCGFYDTVASVIDLSVGIATISRETLVKVYPTPGTGVFEVNLGEVQGNSISYGILSIHGELIKQSYLKPQGDPVIHLDISDQSKGIYFIKVIAGNHNYFGKIVLQ